MSEVDVINRPCPICGHVTAHPARRARGWTLSTCEACGFLYAPTVRANTAVEVVLPEGYEPVWRARHRQILRLLTPLLAENSLVVDIGAGFGELGRLIVRDGKFRYTGFEPSASTAAAARSRGVDLRAELFGPQSLEEPADAVVLDNVLEHLADPKALVRDAVEAIRPGGLLVVIVPNRWDVRQLHPRWRQANHWIPPDHINYFTAGSLKRLLTEAGLDSVRPFAFDALGVQDRRYWPRALLELIGVYPFGLNLYSRRAKPPTPTDGGGLRLPS